MVHPFHARQIACPNRGLNPHSERLLLVLDHGGGASHFVNFKRSMGFVLGTALFAFERPVRFDSWFTLRSFLALYTKFRQGTVSRNLAQRASRGASGRSNG
jgi:hypothetical protein